MIFILIPENFCSYLIDQLLIEIVTGMGVSINKSRKTCSKSRKIFST